MVQSSRALLAECSSSPAWAARWGWGVHFNDGPLVGYWQYADPELLRHDLPRTLWYFHAQPPGFNAFLGTVLHLPHSWEGGAFALRCTSCAVS